MTQESSRPNASRLTVNTQSGASDQLPQLDAPSSVPDLGTPKSAPGVKAPLSEASFDDTTSKWLEDGDEGKLATAPSGRISKRSLRKQPKEAEGDTDMAEDKQDIEVSSDSFQSPARKWLLGVVLFFIGGVCTWSASGIYNGYPPFGKNDGPHYTVSLRRALKKKGLATGHRDEFVRYLQKAKALDIETMLMLKMKRVPQTLTAKADGDLSAKDMFAKLQKLMQKLKIKFTDSANVFRDASIRTYAEGKKPVITYHYKQWVGTTFLGTPYRKLYEAGRFKKMRPANLYEVCLFIIRNKHWLIPLWEKSVIPSFAIPISPTEYWEIEHYGTDKGISIYKTTDISRTVAILPVNGTIPVHLQLTGTANQQKSTKAVAKK